MNAVSVDSPMYSPLSFTFRFCCVFALSAVAVLSNGFAAHSARAQSIWGLHVDDRFTIGIVISRETELTVDGADPVRQIVADQMELDYQVVQVDPSGNAKLNVRIRGALRGDGRPAAFQSQLMDRRLGLLTDTQLSMDVAPDGTIEQVSASDRDVLVRNLAGLSLPMQSVINECCSEELLKVWFGRPFWFAADVTKLQPGYSWDETDLVSLGLLGGIRSDLRIEVAAPSEPADTGKVRAPDQTPIPLREITLLLKGTGTFVPLVGSEQLQKALPTRLAEATVSLDEYSGTARLRHPTGESDPKDPNPRTRPLFDRLDLKCVFSGTCVAADDQKTRSISFRQTQTQSWKLTRWSFGGPPLLMRRLNSIGPAPIPIPEPNP